MHGDGLVGVAVALVEVAACEAIAEDSVFAVVVSMAEYLLQVALSRIGAHQ